MVAHTVGERRVDLVPVPVRVGLDLAIDRHFLGERLPDLGNGHAHRRGGLAVRQHDTVVADLDLGDLLHAVAGALLHFGFLDSAGGIGHVGVLLADATAEQLEPAPRAGALDHRGRELVLGAELLGDCGGERIDRR
jgi:hypothetical protein